MTESGNGTPKILIVDDEAQIRSMLIRSLSDGTCECVPSANAFDALNKIRAEHYSLVLSDICMPGMSGIDLLRSIKKHDPDMSVIMISGVMDLTTAVDSLKMGASDYITKPFDLVSVRRAVGRALERRRLVMENRFYQQELERLVQERTLKLKGALKEVEESYRFTLEALAAALDAREHETQAHSQRVREYAVTLAQTLGIGATELVDVGRGALLHDIGKIGVPDSILLKPGKLTPEEWIQMKRHPQVGYEILRGIKFLEPAAEIVLSHQERWDGGGYPNGLIGKRIPLGARIFCVVDTLDAMTSDRPYRKALPFQAARAEVERCRNTQFDPEVAEAFLSLTPETWQDIHDRINARISLEGRIESLCLK